MPTAQRPLRRNAFFTSGDGVQTLMVRRREVFPLQIDWSNDLADGEVIASSVWEGQCGLVLSTPSFDPVTSITECVISDSTGQAENRITTSEGRVLVEILRVSLMGGRPLDYGR